MSDVGMQKLKRMVVSVLQRRGAVGSCFEDVEECECKWLTLATSGGDMLWKVLYQYRDRSS